MLTAARRPPRRLARWLATGPGIALALLAPVTAQAQDLRIWVDPGFYGIDESNCKPAAGKSTAPILTNIDDRLCSVFSASMRADLAAYFQQQMAASFGAYVVADPAAAQASATSFNRRMRDTLSASIHISRADIWEVDKGNGSHEVHLPNTVSLLLTNASTGEVLFTETRSLIASGVAIASNVAPYAREQLPEQLRLNIAELVKQAAGHFHPYPVSATVRGKVGDDYVIDRGRLAGIRARDTFAGDIRVMYADADYAIVRQEGMESRLASGSTITKQNVQPADYLAKYAATVIMGRAPSGMSAAYLKQTFEEKLGATTIFSIATVNPNLQSIRTNAASALQSDANNNERLFPKYVVYVESFVTEPSDIGTNLPGVRLKTYEAYSIAHIVDQQGRVVYSRVASDRIVDEVAGGIGFPDDQRQDTVVRNSLEKLAGLIQAEFKPRNERLPIELAGTDSVVADAGGTLAEGTTGLILRKAGKYPSIAVPVWTPIDPDERRVNFIDGRAILSGGGLGGGPAKGDVFAVDAAGQAAVSRRSFGLCQSPADLPPGDLSGSPLVRAIGRALFSSAMRIPLFLEELAPLASAQLSEFHGQDTMGVTRSHATDVCIKPILRATPLEPSRVGRDQQAARFAISVGYTLHGPSGERLAGNGMQAEMTSMPLPLQTPQNQVANVNLRDLTAEMNKIAPQTLPKIDIPK